MTGGAEELRVAIGHDGLEPDDTDHRQPPPVVTQRVGTPESIVKVIDLGHREHDDETRRGALEHSVACGASDRKSRSSAFALDLDFGCDVAGDRADRQSCHFRWLKTAVRPAGG